MEDSTNNHSLMTGKMKQFPRDSHQRYCSCSYKFNILLKRLFYKLGLSIGSNPWPYIIVPVLITAISMTGFYHINIEKDPEYIYSPSDSVGKKDRKVVESLFHVDYDNFDPSRISRLTTFLRALVTTKDNGTILRKSIWNDLNVLDRLIKNITLEWHGQIYTYNDLCARKNGKCVGNQIYSLNRNIEDIEKGRMKLTYPVTFFPFIVLPYCFGGMEIDEEKKVMISAKGVSISYWFKAGNHELLEIGHEWEAKILNVLANTEFDTIAISYMVSRTLQDEIYNSLSNMRVYLPISLTMMVVFCAFSVHKGDWVRSKLHISSFGVLSALLSTVCGFGILMYCGVPFTSNSSATPFLLIGIGVDDMFVVLSAWHKTNLRLDVPTRLAETYRETAASVTLTSLTNVISFLVGSFSTFPSIQFFCLYTGVSLFVCYVWFVSFFGGILALSGRREKQQKHIITGRKIKSKAEAVTENKSACYQWWCTGGINQSEPWVGQDRDERSLDVFFRDYIARGLATTTAKVVTSCLFLIYLSIAIYSCMSVREGMDVSQIPSKHSYAMNHTKMEGLHFSEQPVFIQVVINEKVTYSDPSTRKALLKLHEDLEDLKGIQPKIFTQSWIRDFYDYLDWKFNQNLQDLDEEEFIKILIQDYLEPTESRRTDIVLGNNDTEIIASRFIIQGLSFDSLEERKELMVSVRTVAEESPFEAITNNIWFVMLDQMLKLKFSTVKTIAIAAASVTVVSFIFIPNPLCSWTMTFSLLSIEVGVIGYMTFLDVNIDPISMVTLIMCIGLSVDFSAHVCYAFLAAEAKTPTDRLREALYKVGVAVVQGGLSTMIGIAALAFGSSYLETTFFKIVFLVSLIGMLHGIIVLPMALSFLWTFQCMRTNSGVENTQTEVELNKFQTNLE